MPVRKLLFVAMSAFILPVLLVAQDAFNNDSIVKMVKAGLSDALIISTINSKPGNYDTSVDGIIALKTAGTSDKVVAAIMQKTSDSSPAPAAPPVTPPDPSPAPPPVTGDTVHKPTDSNRATDARPRIYLSSASKGPNRAAARDQSMEMSKDLEKDCPGVRVTVNSQAADYSILLNHIEAGLLVRDNQIQIANKDGDLISRTKEGGSIKNDVKKACEIILADWTKK